jgi:hypothetical protein
MGRSGMVVSRGGIDVGATIGRGSVRVRESAGNPISKCMTVHSPTATFAVLLHDIVSGLLYYFFIFLNG